MQKGSLMCLHCGEISRRLIAYSKLETIHFYYKKCWKCGYSGCNKKRNNGSKHSSNKKIKISKVESDEVVVGCIS